MEDAYIYIYERSIYIYFKWYIWDNRNIVSRDDNPFCVCMCVRMCARVCAERVIYFDGARTPKRKYSGEVVFMVEVEKRRFFEIDGGRRT